MKGGDKMSTKFEFKDKDEWDSYKKWLKVIPHYMILERASNIILNFEYENYSSTPIEDQDDDFYKLFNNANDIAMNLDKFAIMIKTLQTIKKRPLN